MLICQLSPGYLRQSHLVDPAASTPLCQYDIIVVHGNVFVVVQPSRDGNWAVYRIVCSIFPYFSRNHRPER